MTQIPDPESPGAAVRRLIRGCDRAVLSTAQRDAEGWPYGSLVITACDHAARPLVLISTLADHTKNILQDDRVSLLFDGTAGLEEILTGARATVLGRAAKLDDGAERDALLARFTARHPTAELYRGFADFSLYRVSVERAHLVAGFGRIHWIDGAEVLFDASGCAALADQEAGVVAHMNADHADAVADYAAGLLGLDGDGWHLTGVDPEGCDLRRGGAVARLDFAKPAADAEAARVELVRLVKAARRARAEGADAGATDCAGTAV